MNNLDSLSKNGGGMLKNFKSLFTMNRILYGLLILILIALIIFTIKHLTNKYKTKYNENSVKYEGSSTEGVSNKDAELMLFFTTWCPHCKTAKPEWEQIKTEYEGKTVNGYNLIFTEIDCTNDSPDVEKLMSQYKVEGYPTIKMIKDGQVIEFDAKPTKETLTQFINSVI